MATSYPAINLMVMLCMRDALFSPIEGELAGDLLNAVTKLEGLVRTRIRPYDFWVLGPFYRALDQSWQARDSCSGTEDCCCSSGTRDILFTDAWSEVCIDTLAVRVCAKLPLPDWVWL